MTRCYEAYCYFKNKMDEACKSERTMQRVKQYVEFMESKGVEFSKKKTDKMLFLKLQDKFGSEYHVTQPSVLTQRVVKCDLCGYGTYSPQKKDGKNLCPKCATKTEKEPSLLKEKPKVAPQRTEKREYKPKLSWPERKELMHPRVSKMEEAIRLRLEEAKIPFQANHEFCVVHTKPDFYFPQVNLGVYLDGEKVHMKREGKDERLRELLQKRHGIKSIAIVYKDNSKVTEDEIFKQILSAVSDVAGRG